LVQNVRIALSRGSGVAVLIAMGRPQVTNLVRKDIAVIADFWKWLFTGLPLVVKGGK